MSETPVEKGYLTVTDLQGHEHVHHYGNRWVNNTDASLLIYAGTELIGEYARGTWLAVRYALKEKS